MPVDTTSGLPAQSESPPLSEPAAKTRRTPEDDQRVLMTRQMDACAGGLPRHQE